MIAELSLVLTAGSPRVWVRMRIPGLDEHEAVIELSKVHTLETLAEWAANPASFPDTDLQPLRTPWHSREVSYSHETGKITLHHPAGDTKFDASDDEAVAKFVRQLKRIAAMPVSKHQEKLPIELPAVTAEDLATKRTVYKNTAGMGYKKASKPKERSMSAIRSEEIIKGLLDAMIEGT